MPCAQTEIDLMGIRDTLHDLQDAYQFLSAAMLALARADAEGLAEYHAGAAAVLDLLRTQDAALRRQLDHCISQPS